MNPLKRASIVSSIILIMFLLGCATLSPNPTVNLTSVNGTAISSASTLLAQTMTALPTSTVVPTSTESTVPTVEAVPTVDRPNFKTAEIPGMLRTALKFETLKDFNEHDLWRISGWRYGFSGIEWAGTKHLVLYPYAGMVPHLDGMTIGKYPIIANIDFQGFWVPNSRLSLSWSEKLGVFVVPQGSDSVVIYRPDGGVVNIYSGALFGVSPSGTKILIDGDTWLDLGSGKIVDFAWYQTGYAADYARAHQFPPIWSSDEMRIYACCYAYGDARTGESFVMPYDGITLDGDRTNYSLLAFGGTWVLKDKYMMPIWYGAWDDRLSSVYLFDPTAKTYRNLSARAGINVMGGDAANPYCNRPSAQNGGKYVWVDCQDGGHLIDIAGFSSRAYPPFGQPGNFSISNVDWSADGKFALLYGDGFMNMLSAVDGEMKESPVGESGTWHPTESKVAYFTGEGKVLSILDAATMSTQEKELSIMFRGIAWSPGGEYMALWARDGSIWQIAYPELGDPEQLTGPIENFPTPSYGASPSGKGLTWSSDDTAIEFVICTDVYIVTTGNKP